MKTMNISALKEASALANPLKVCMLFLEEAGRTESRVMRDAIALVEAGYAVTIVDIEKERTRPVEEDIRGVHFKHIFLSNWYTPTRYKPWYLVKLAWAFICTTLRLLQTPADIYHAHNERALPACYVAARLRHKPLIFDAPELTLSEPRYTRWRWLNAVSTRIITGVLRRSAGIIATSSLHAKEIQNSFHVQEEVTLVRNVPPYRTVLKSDRLRKYLGLGPNVRIALYQGNLQPNRGLHVLVRAAPYLESDTIIVMMGRGVEPALSQLQSLIVSEQVADRVKIIPPVSYDELLDWTASADIGLTVYPLNRSLNVQTSLPNKLFEYLMAGLPVLSSQLEAIAEVITTYDAGRILPSLAPADIGAAINTMLADHDGLARMRHNALEVARSEFCWEKEKQNLFGLYDEILSKQDKRYGTQNSLSYGH